MKGSRSSETFSLRDVIYNLKMLHKHEGMEACAELVSILSKKMGDRSPEKIIFFIEMIYKIDTCKADCFEDLPTKQICQCDCNGEPIKFAIPYDDQFGEA